MILTAAPLTLETDDVEIFPEYISKASLVVSSIKTSAKSPPVDKLTSSIPKEQKYKIYISALTVLNMDHYNRISTTDTRLVRRIVRDNQFRGYTAAQTISTWHNVNRGEQRNIFPFQEDADSIFNTSLIYELGALKAEAEPLLENIKNDQPEYAEAQRLLEILRYFEPISKDIVPSHSLLKEFLGGGDF